jgi:hypothetical protein
LKFSHGRAFNFNVGVTPVNWSLFVVFPFERSARINLADIDAADNGDFAVDDQNLAVVPVCQCPFLPGLQRIYRIEFNHLNSPVPHALKKRSGSLHTAHAVIK